MAGQSALKQRDPDLEQAIDGALEYGLIENLAHVRQQLKYPPRNPDRHRAVKMHLADLNDTLRGYADRAGVSPNEFEALCEAEARQRMRGRMRPAPTETPGAQESKYDRHARLANEAEWRIQTLSTKLSAARKDLVEHREWLAANPPILPEGI
jgi:hypothetical protein